MGAGSAPGPSEGHRSEEQGHDDTSCTAGGCARRRGEGHLLCDPHSEKLDQMLNQLRAEITRLDPVPSNGGAKGGSRTLARERTPVRLDVLVHLDHRAGTGWSETDSDAKAAGRTIPIWPMLRQWEHYIRTGRQMPRRGAPAGDLIVFVGAHLDWSCTQPWIGAMYDDLRVLLRQLQRVNGTAPDPPVGKCFLPAADTGVCGGPIWMDEASGTANCGRCLATWDGPQLALLKFELEEARLEAARPKSDDGQPMLTAREIVDAGLATSKANVYLRASRAGINAVRGHYDRRLFE